MERIESFNSRLREEATACQKKWEENNKVSTHASVRRRQHAPLRRSCFS